MNSTETKLPEEIIAACSHGRVRLFRAQVGRYRTKSGGYVDIGTVGFPDVHGFIQRDDSPALVVFIECKRRDGKGKLSNEQKAFRANCIRMRALHFVCKSVEEAQECLKKYQ